jgi:hypothetical protein
VNPAHSGPIRPLPVVVPAFAGLGANDSPHRLATGVLLPYLFLVTSRGVEMIQMLIGANIHLTLTLMLLSLVAALFMGGLLKATKAHVFLFSSR